MADKKIYLGNGTEKFDGDLVEFSLNLTKLTAEASEHINEWEGSKYIKLKVCKKKGGADEYGKTHYIEVDTFKPTKEKATAKADDLPF